MRDKTQSSVPSHTCVQPRWEMLHLGSPESGADLCHASFERYGDGPHRRQSGEASPSRLEAFVAVGVLCCAVLCVCGLRSPPPHAVLRFHHHQMWFLFLHDSRHDVLLWCSGHCSGNAWRAQSGECPCSLLGALASRFPASRGSSRSQH